MNTRPARVILADIIAKEEIGAREVGAEVLNTLMPALDCVELDHVHWQDFTTTCNLLTVGVSEMTMAALVALADWVNTKGKHWSPIPSSNPVPLRFMPLRV